MSVWAAVEADFIDGAVYLGVMTGYRLECMHCSLQDTELCVPAPCCGKVFFRCKRNFNILPGEVEVISVAVPSIEDVDAVAARYRVSVGNGACIIPAGTFPELPNSEIRVYGEGWEAREVAREVLK